CRQTMRVLRRILFTTAMMAIGAVVHAAEARVLIPGGRFESVLPPAPGVKFADVASFRLDVAPVTDAEYARFVHSNPAWRRDRVGGLFADEGYLQHWKSAT